MKQKTKSTSGNILWKILKLHQFILLKTLQFLTEIFPIPLPIVTFSWDTNKITCLMTITILKMALRIVITSGVFRILSKTARRILWYKRTTSLFCMMGHYFFILSLDFLYFQGRKKDPRGYAIYIKLRNEVFIRYLSRKSNTIRRTSIKINFDCTSKRTSVFLSSKVY